MPLNFYNKREVDINEKKVYTVIILIFASNNVKVIIFGHRNQFVGLSNICYSDNKKLLSTCFGESQPKGRIGKLL